MHNLKTRTLVRTQTAESLPRRFVGHIEHDQKYGVGADTADALMVEERSFYQPFIAEPDGCWVGIATLDDNAFVILNEETTAQDLRKHSKADLSLKASLQRTAAC
ncbi:hypothetical protein [uncultured Roseobacter sp.]|uniref:hypothetical protein n=1 Tax=uncultured Roseobacter sp. TaxID=114847 RepID=UPI0026312C4D|nr:hypothetical protein [uncultured Roseobacter sp.]